MIESMKSYAASEVEAEEETGESEFTDKCDLLDAKFKEVEKLSNTPIIENLR
jgi:hypothetical protein